MCFYFRSRYYKRQLYLDLLWHGSLRVKQLALPIYWTASDYFPQDLWLVLDSIGPLIGIGYFARQSVAGLGVNRDAYPQLFSFTFISEAIIETPLLFAFVVGLMLLYASNTGHDAFVRGTIYISAALCTGIAAIMPSISSGKVASAASKEIALTPERYTNIARASMLVQALLDTFIVYATLVSLMMLFVVK